MQVMSTQDKAIAVLYQEHAESIYRFIVWHSNEPLIAEDIVAETFYRAWKHRESLEQASHPKAWLYRVAKTLLAVEGRRKNPATLDDQWEPVSDVDIHGEAMSKEQSRQLRRALQQLPDGMRSVIIMRFFEHLSSEEVATIMNTTPGNIRVIQYRALKQLKSLYRP